MALSGGRLPEDWNDILLDVLENRISIISTMHQLLSEKPVLRDAARKNGVEIIDLRKPKPIDQLHFWSGEIYKVRAPKIAVLGMDCAIGKRTTARFITEMCRQEGIRTEMIYTGQTGWLQGYKHGFIFDATLNDFVSGELEHAVVECDRQSSPDLILIEGQSGLRNPSGPCGSEIIVSANVKGVILQHAPFRKYYEDLEHLNCLLPDVKDEIELIRMYGAQTLAVTLNGEGGTREELADYRQRTCPTTPASRRMSPARRDGRPAAGHTPIYIAATSIRRHLQNGRSETHQVAAPGNFTDCKIISGQFSPLSIYRNLLVKGGPNAQKRHTHQSTYC